MVIDRDQLVQDELSRLIRTRAPGSTPAAAIREYVLDTVEGIRRIPAGQWRGELGFLAAISPTVYRLSLEMSDRQASALAAAIAETEAVAPELRSATRPRLLFYTGRFGNALPSTAAELSTRSLRPPLLSTRLTRSLAHGGTAPLAAGS